MATTNLGLIQAMHRGASAPSNTQLLWYKTTDNKIYYYDSSLGSWAELAKTLSSVYRSDVTSLGVGNNTVTFSSPLPSDNYTLVLYDYTGAVTPEIVSQAADSFVVKALAAGSIIYQALIKQ